MNDNKIIAEFMGNVHPTNDTSVGLDLYTADELKYDRSWDWLMPVVSKCFKTGDDTHQWDDIMDTMFTCDINIVYAQVVEFIQEYNDGCHQTYKR